jgi:hypothetical protein
LHLFASVRKTPAQGITFALVEVIVYVGRADELLLVPSCFLPSAEAQHAHGPLSLRGRLTFEESSAGVWKRVVGDIERHSYAVLTAAAAKRLLGRNHPCLRPHVSSSPLAWEPGFTGSGP